jgi:hemerythrin
MSKREPTQGLNAGQADDELRRLRALLDAEIATRQGLERRHVEALTAYARFVPPQLLQLLGKDSILDVDWGNQAEKKMTILFSDIRGFASMSERMTPQQCFDFINAYLSFMEPVVLAHGGFIDKYIGDSVMALFPARGDDALHAALGMLAELDQFNAQRAVLQRELPFEHPERQSGEVHIGIGMNSGLLTLGVIGGSSRMEVTVISDAVNLASRVETLTKTYQTPILITQHTLNSIRYPSDFSIRFIDRVRVRGKHLAQSIYEVFDADPAPLKAAKLASRDAFEDALAHYHFRRMDEALARFGDCLEHNPGDTPAAVYWQRCRQAHRIVDGDEAFESDSVAHWRSEYLLDFPSFDEMHQVIFSHIVTLAEALQRGAAGPAEQLAGRLLELTNEHFDSEERMMEAHGYGHSPSAEHHQQHQKFREFLQSLAADIRSGQVAPLRLAFRCQFLLLDWFISHISITDRHFERFLAGRLPPDF